MRTVLLASCFVLQSINLHASNAGAVAQLILDPATIRQGDADKTTIKTRVVLQTPSRTFFICQLRSDKKRELACTNIIFKKGDIEGTGTATVYWSEVPEDGDVKVSAFSVDAPDASVSFTATLHKKHEDDL